MESLCECSIEPLGHIGRGVRYFLKLMYTIRAFIKLAALCIFLWFIVLTYSTIEVYVYGYVSAIYNFGCNSLVYWRLEPVNQLLASLSTYPQAGKWSISQFWGEIWSCLVSQLFLAFWTGIPTQINGYPNSSQCWIETNLICWPKIPRQLGIGQMLLPANKS